MSLWDRLKGAVGRPAAPVPTAAPAEPPRVVAPAAPPAATALDALRALASAAALPSDAESKATALVARAAEEGLESEAIDLARKLVLRASFPTLALRVAERLDARGDDLGASTVLGPLVDAAGASLDAIMLAAEIAERRGDGVRALALYERVVARDFGYPRARERAMRLRDAHRGTEARDGGATLASDGAAGRGRFRVKRELGRGGAGTVFLAEDAPLGRDVALKIYQRRGRADRLRMLHEARVPVSLAHPSVVRILDVDELVMGIAMELCEGSVRAELARGPIAPARVASIVAAIAEVLAFVHAAGWAHRDVKPSNVLLAGDRVVLTDFGIASRLGEPGAPGEGSLGYMSKEQRAGKNATVAMDVHALGATLLEMIVPLGAVAPAPLVALGRAATADDPSARPSLDHFLALR